MLLCECEEVWHLSHRHRTVSSERVIVTSEHIHLTRLKMIRCKSLVYEKMDQNTLWKYAWNNSKFGQYQLNGKIPQKVLDRPINIEQFGNINNYKIWELAEIELKTAILGDFLATFGLFICVTDPLGMVRNRFHSLKMWNECGSFVSIVSELCWSIWGIKNTWATIKTILLTFNGFDEWEKLI